MFRMQFVAVSLAAVLLSATAFAGSPAFTRIDNPGDPTFNQLLGINNSGVISGYFGSGQAGHPNQAYTIAPPYTAFVPGNLPGATQTQPTAITPSGATVGFWSATSTGTDANFGYIREANGFTYLTVNNPLGAGSHYVNQLLGMNNANIAVGFYLDGNGMPQGYAYTVKTGVFTPVTVQGASSTLATGINSHNLICGSFVDGAGMTEGFIQPLTGGGVVTTFTVPGFTVTQLLGINAHGVAVGFYADAQNIPHGLVYNSANGAWTIVNDPAGLNGTVLNGINDKGQIVGFYTDGANNTHGILVTGVE